MMKYNNNTRIIIGLDHGYGNIKTAHRAFTTGVERFEEEPIVSMNYVKYKDKYYVIGESHLVYQGNKTDSQDFFILTLAGLAEELKFRQLHEANVVLAVGLPLAWAKSQAADFKRYLMQETELDFTFRKERYRVHLCGVEIFPQGFAAICNAGSMRGMNMMADVGNGTMNVMQIVDGRPLEKSFVTDKFGVSICMKEIQKELSKNSGESIPEMLIEPLLREGIQERTDAVAKTVQRIAGQYAENILKRLIDYGYKENLVHLYVAVCSGIIVTLVKSRMSLSSMISVLMQRDMSIWQYRSSTDRGKCNMRKTYKCSNVKFCMEDENQRRTWEYLQGITRKDGSYGKVLSDIFVAFLDGQDREKENDEVRLPQAGQLVESETLEQVLEKVMEKMLSDMQVMLGEQIRCCFSEYEQAFSRDAVRTADNSVRAQTEETQEQELSEDMMAFAFEMGE